MRSALDPNVLISGVLSRSSAPAELLRRCVAGELGLVVSHNLLDELERALEYPKLRARISFEDASALLSLRREGASAVDVSGDRDLLDLSPRFPVLTARAFLAELQAAPGAE